MSSCKKWSQTSRRPSSDWKISFWGTRTSRLLFAGSYSTPTPRSFCESWWLCSCTTALNLVGVQSVFERRNIPYSHDKDCSLADVLTCMCLQNYDPRGKKRVGRSDLTFVSLRSFEMLRIYPWSLIVRSQRQWCSKRQLIELPMLLGSMGKVCERWGRKVRHIYSLKTTLEARSKDTGVCDRKYSNKKMTLLKPETE